MFIPTVWKNRRRHCLNPPLSPGGKGSRYGQVSANVAGAHKLIESIWLGLPRGRPQVGLAYLTYGSFPPGFVDPDSGLLGFVGPDGLFGLFILPPIDEPPIVEPEPEGEVADGLLVKPGGARGTCGRVARRGRISSGARRSRGATSARTAAHSRSAARTTTSGAAARALRIDRGGQGTQCEAKCAADKKT